MFPRRVAGLLPALASAGLFVACGESRPPAQAPASGETAASCSARKERLRGCGLSDDHLELAEISCLTEDVCMSQFFTPDAATGFRACGATCDPRCQASLPPPEPAVLWSSAKRECVRWCGEERASQCAEPLRSFGDAVIAGVVEDCSASDSCGALVACYGMKASRATADFAVCMAAQLPKGCRQRADPEACEALLVRVFEEAGARAAR